MSGLVCFWHARSRGLCWQEGTSQPYAPRSIVILSLNRNLVGIRLAKG